MSAIRQAIRSLFRTPGFVLTVVLTLGVGVGLNAAIFTVVDCVVLRPLGYRDADRIYQLRTHFDDEGRSIRGIGGGNYTDAAHDLPGVEAAAYYRDGQDGIGLNGGALYLYVASVSPRFGDALGVQPIAGRMFHDDGKESHLALVSEGFARTQFGTPSAALGKPLTSSGEIYTISGVLPEGFRFPGTADVWLELPSQPANPNRTANNQRAVLKAKPGVSGAQLAAQVAALSQHLKAVYPEDRTRSLEVLTLQDSLVGRLRPTIQLLMGAVGLVLLIVCANLAHLQLVRGVRERRAIAVRAVLGASRAALLRGPMLHALLLGLAGAVLALAVANGALLFVRHMAPADTPRLLDIHLNRDVLFFSLLVSLAVMFVTALFPAWSSLRFNAASTVAQESSRTTETRRSLRFREGLVVAEIALTLALSTTAVLLTRKLVAASHEELGFAPDRLLMLDTHAVTPSLSSSKETEQEADARRLTYLRRLDSTMDEIGRLPGIVSVAAMSGAPMGPGGSDVYYAVRGKQSFTPPFRGLADADVRPATPGIFATLGVPVLRGRGISAEDVYTAPHVVVIDQALAQLSFPGEDPLGHQIECGFDEKQPWTIVGVVGSVRGNSPGEPPRPAMYLPVSQHPWNSNDIQVLARTREEAPGMLLTLHNVLSRTHPEIAVVGSTVRANIGKSEQAERFRTFLFSSFAIVSVLLAVVGMFGVTAYNVAQRRFEFALRFAMGAQRTQVMGRVVRQAATTAVLGILVGVPFSIGLLRYGASMLGTLPRLDPVSMLLACVGILLFSLLATILPSRRAATVEPMQVLRSE